MTPAKNEAVAMSAYLPLWFGGETFSHHDLVAKLVERGIGKDSAHQVVAEMRLSGEIVPVGVFLFRVADHGAAGTVDPVAMAVRADNASAQLFRSFGMMVSSCSAREVRRYADWCHFHATAHAFNRPI